MQIYGTFINASVPASQQLKMHLQSAESTLFTLSHYNVATNVKNVTISTYTLQVN